MESRILKMLLLVAAMLVSMWPGPLDALEADRNPVPTGADILFRDEMFYADWQGAKAGEGGDYGIEGRVLTTGSYGDTVRFEKVVDFVLGRENRMAFDFVCTGYERLRVLAWTKGGKVPKRVTLTRFEPGEARQVDIPVEGNFHDYHWREGNYEALQEGDRITRLAFEFSLHGGSPENLAVGAVTVYSVTGQVLRRRLSELVDSARTTVEMVPDSLAQRKQYLSSRLETLVNGVLGESAPDEGELRAGLAAVAEVKDRASRLVKYYEAAARASPGLDDPDYCVGWESSLRRVTHQNPDLRFEGRVPARPSISLAANEREAFQLVIIPFNRFLSDVRLTASDLTGPGGRLPASNVSFGRLLTVRTKLSPHSNGMDLGWVPDPIQPLRPGEHFDVQPEAEQAVWVSVSAPTGTAPGTYKGTLTIQPLNSHSIVVPLTVTVWNYELPVRGMFRTQGHFSIESVENFYHRGMNTSWLREWYSFWLDYRFDPVGQYSSYLTPRPGLIPFCLERGLRTINLGGFSGVGRVDRAALDSVYRSVKERGWLGHSYVYIGDETDDFELMREKADLIHTRYPGVRVMIGGSIPREELVGYIDVWDPIMRPGGVYGFAPGPCREALARGEEVLWYPCIAPHPPYPNVQMEDELADSRSIFWMTYKYDIMGYEYWGYNVWSDNVRQPGEPRWPDRPWDSYSFDHTNGDGQLCYPGPEGLPWPSVRLAVNRDGIEDWEALWLLEDLARTADELELGRQDRDTAAMIRRARELGDVPDRVVTDLTHYTKDPEVILGHRDEVSRLIVALQERIGPERAADYRKRHIEQRKALERESLERNIEAARERSR